MKQKRVKKKKQWKQKRVKTKKSEKKMIDVIAVIDANGIWYQIWSGHKLS